MLKAEAIDLKRFPLYFAFEDTKAIRDVLSTLRDRQALDTLDEIDTSEHKIIDRLVFDHLGLSPRSASDVISALKALISSRAAKSKT